MQFHRQPISGNAHRLKKLLTKNFPRMHRPSRRTFVLNAHDFFPRATLVVIRYFHVEGIAIPPHEAYAELIVDSDAMLSHAVPAQLLQPVARRNPQILQPAG